MVGSVSPFHDIPEAEWIVSNVSGFSIWDRFPVNPGHALVIPRRAADRWWDLTRTEQAAILDLITETRVAVDARFQPTGYNVGFNDGAAAGQTVAQLHVHVIPRYRGDVVDPRGGVRHVIPERGNYLVGKAKL